MKKQISLLVKIYSTGLIVLLGNQLLGEIIMLYQCVCWMQTLLNTNTYTALIKILDSQHQNINNIMLGVYKWRFSYENQGSLNRMTKSIKGGNKGHQQRWRIIINQTILGKECQRPQKRMASFMNITMRQEVFFLQLFVDFLRSQLQWPPG